MILLKDLLLTMCLSTLGLQAPQEHRSFPIYYRSFNSCYCLGEELGEGSRLVQHYSQADSATVEKTG